MFKSVKIFLIYVLFNYFFLVFSGSLENIRMMKISNYSVKVEWDKVKICFIYGFVVLYEVYFCDVEGGSMDLMYNVIVFVEEDRRLDFINLEIYWKYGVCIKVIIVKGFGLLSLEIIGMIDEWGMIFC